METQEMEEVLMRKKRMGMLLCMILMAAALLPVRGKRMTRSRYKNSRHEKGRKQRGADSKGGIGERDDSSGLEVTLLSGKTVKLSDYRGKRVLLNFWATWCGPCVQEMPAFQRLSEDYPDDVVILAVNCGESKEEVESFVQKNGYTFPIALDENLEASNLYPATSIPLTLIVDEEGDIVYSSYGASDADTMYAHYKEELGL